MLSFLFTVRIKKETYTTSILLLERVYGITPVITSTDKWSLRKEKNFPWKEEVRSGSRSTFRKLTDS